MLLDIAKCCQMIVISMTDLKQPTEYISNYNLVIQDMCSYYHHDDCYSNFI